MCVETHNREKLKEKCNTIDFCATGVESLLVFGLGQTYLIEHSDEHGRVVTEVDHESLRLLHFPVIAVAHLVHIVEKQIPLTAELDADRLRTRVDAAQQDLHLDGFKRARRISAVDLAVT